MSLRAGIRRLFRLPIRSAAGAHADADEELDALIASRVEYLVARGMSPHDARREALARLGAPLDQARRQLHHSAEHREHRMRFNDFVASVVEDLQYAVRGVMQRPGFTVVAVLTLAIGIGGTTAVFSAVNAVLLQPLPYQQPGQLVRLYQYSRGQAHDKGFVTPVHYLAYRDGMSSFESAAAVFTYSQAGADIGRGALARRIRILRVSADYFDVLRVHPEIGRSFRREEENGGPNDGDPAVPVVVLSDALWRDQFQSDPSVIGKSLTMSAVPHTIVGVMPPRFDDPVAGTIDAWIPGNLTPGRGVANNADNHYLTVIARLRPGVPVARSQEELDALSRTLAQRFPSGARDALAWLVPLKEDVVEGSSRSLELMLGAVGLLLLLVCVNVAGLLLVRGSERFRELALRSALGADRWRIVRQLLTESVMLALLGGVAGLLVARVSMFALVRLSAGSIPRLDGLSLDPVLLAFSSGVATVSALVFGTLPALRAARVDPADVLRDQTRSTTGGVGQARLRVIFAATQLAVAFMLVVGAGLLLASFQRLHTLNLGFAPEHVLTFDLSLPAARYDSAARGRFYEAFAQRVERIPGVRAAGGVSKLPGTGDFHQWGVTAQTGPLAGTRSANTSAENRVVSGDYFRALGIPILRGRAFDERDGVVAKPPHLIISQSLADKVYPGVDPLGQTLSAGRDVGIIIGVVPDVAVNVEGRNVRYVYHAHTNFAGERVWSLSQTVTTSGSPLAIAAEVRRVLADMDPELVMYRPAPLTDVVGRGEAERTFTLRILSAFALIALGLAALGLFGVLSFAVARRTREFGVRIALGATRRTIGALVLRQGLGVAAIGLAVGLVGAAATTRLMASLVFQVSPLDPRVLGSAAVFMTLVAAAAAYLPAMRAAKTDPADTLRQE